ncbi:O10C1 protein, partial [Xiphorhynchus elegans]|nr:O10C1 protein [Xiphorhynchus elegans]
ILGNIGEMSEFRLLGFSEISHLHPLLIVVLLSLYILTLMANIVIALIINGDNTLHIPMYFFLTQLSCLDICYLSIIIPDILENLIVGTIVVSKARCAMQMFSFLFFGVTQCFLLADMSLDHYVAVCCPLHYTIIIKRKICKSLIAGTYVCGSAVALVHTIITFSLPFSGFTINHFFHEIQLLLDLLCGNTFPSEIQDMVAVFAVLCPFLMIIYSYIHIISTILQMSSAESQQKTFSTCSSHLLVVILFYATANSMYLRPKYSYSASVDKFLSLYYSVATPLLNTIICSSEPVKMKKPTK